MDDGLRNLEVPDQAAVDAELARLKEQLLGATERVKAAATEGVAQAEQVARAARSSRDHMRAVTPARRSLAPIAAAYDDSVTAKFKALGSR